ncbi:hypothetical protein [Qipengyuania sp. DGS5-3]|uniref:hypothetical protein n=1 Tax=Qipengyuania sp. DGS5-3 TaxID=3349632 RepID=UPI0036D2605D
MMKAALSLSKHRHGISASVLALTAGLALSPYSASAQSGPDGPEPPPSFDTETPTGVSIDSGAYNYSEADLAIGQGEWPQALSLTRSYRSDMDVGLANASGVRTQGWSTNIYGRITARATAIEGAGDLDPGGGFPDPTNEPEWVNTSVVLGTGSIGFLDSSVQSPGPYEPDSRRRDTLTYLSNGKHRYIASDGAELMFATVSNGYRIESWLAADGTKLTYHYSSNGQPKAVFSSRAQAILFEQGTANTWSKACVVNLAEHYVLPASNCPAGVQSVSYGYTFPSGKPPQLVSATSAVGDTTQYQYSSRDHISCIKQAGQSSCLVSNTYNVCQPQPNTPTANVKRFDQVISQTLATGETYTFSFDPTPNCPIEPTGSPNSTQVLSVTDADGAVTTLGRDHLGRVKQITDPLGRVTTREFMVGEPGFFVDPLPEAQVLPNGRRMEFTYVGGNLSQTLSKPVAGSGNTNIVASASYASSCTSTTRKTCNKPTSTTDAEGNTTNYTYASQHGGMLTATQPADSSGIRPQTRYTYAQRYAWFKNSSGSYRRASTPVWVLISEEFCKSTAASGSGCAGGASDEVVTTYEYQNGSSSKGSNLFRVGMAVTADGQTLRTCYGLDEYGRQISETQPKAGLTSCQ